MSECSDISGKRAGTGRRCHLAIVTFQHNDRTPTITGAVNGQNIKYVCECGGGGPLHRVLNNECAGRMFYG